MATAIDDIKVELGIGSPPLGTTITWTDVTKYWQTISIARGKQAEVSQFAAGTATVVFKNQSFVFDGDNPSPPWAPHKITPSTPVRISVNVLGTQTNLFYGYVQPLGGLTIADSADGHASTATLNCVDFMSMLAALNLVVPGAAVLPNGQPVLTGVQVGVSVGPPKLYYAGLHSGSQILLLAADGVLPSPTPGWVISTGQALVQPYVGGTTALQWLQTMADTEGGFFFINKDGKPTFLERYDALVTSGPSIEFDDLPGADVSYREFTKDYADAVYNDIQLTANGQQLVEVTDTASITAYTETSLSVSGLFCNDSAEVQARADWFLAAYKDPIVAPTQLTIDARRDVTHLAAAANAELRQYVQVDRKPPGAVSQIFTPCYIQHIAHSISINGQFSTTFTFDPGTRFGFTDLGTYGAYGVGDQYYDITDPGSINDEWGY